MSAKSDIKKPRPPIVVVMGHVDHGKTTLLDTVRAKKTRPEKTKPVKAITDQEAGGITQHIGAYEVEHSGDRITFVDTPGHEAFSAMRARGAKVADIALLVIAADDGVKPQTKEAVEHIKKSELPFIVVLNKIDKKTADPERVKSELAELEVLVEERGGKVPAVSISAKDDKNIDELLDVIVLVAELEELIYNPVDAAEGYVLESHLDSKRGVTTSLVVTNGTLRVGDLLVCGLTYGKIKLMEDSEGKTIKGAVPSTPVQVIGVAELTCAGDPCRRVESEEEAKRLIEKNKSHIKKRVGELRVEPPGEKSALSVVLKADTAGSLEAIVDSIRQIHSERVGIKIARCDCGDVNESDAKFAQASDAPIFAFRVAIDKQAQNYAEKKRVVIKKFEIIYDLLEEVRNEMSHILQPEMVRKEIGQATIITIFRTEPSKMIVGGLVSAGKLQKGAMVDIVRNGEKVGSGKIAKLQQKEETKDEVGKGKEAGILFEGKEKIQEGDVLEAYVEEKVYPEL